MQRAANHPEVRKIIQTTLDKGELIKAIHDFAIVKTEDEKNHELSTTVLSEQGIYFMSFKKDYEKNIVLTGKSMTSISRITNITIKGKKLFLGQKALVLNILWGGSKISLMSKDVDRALEFAGTLQAVIKKSYEQSEKDEEDLNRKKEFKLLKNEEIVLKEEIESIKEIFLECSTEKKERFLFIIRNLNAFKKQGFLTDAEFSIKKQKAVDILYSE